VRTAEVEDEFHTTIRDDVMLVLRRIARFKDPKTLDSVLEEFVRAVLVVFHVPTLSWQRRLPARYYETADARCRLSLRQPPFIEEEVGTLDSTLPLRRQATV